MTIENESDYKAALATIRELWGAEPGTSDGDRLELLIGFVEKYEEKYFPIESTTVSAPKRILIDTESNEGPHRVLVDVESTSQ